MSRGQFKEGQTPSWTDIFLDEAFMRNWRNVREAILPVWQKVLGELPSNFNIDIKHYDEIPPPKTYRDAIRVGQAEFEKGSALVIYLEDEKGAFYCNIFHELVHLWTHRSDRDFSREVWGLRPEPWRQLKELINKLSNDKQDELFDIIQLFYPEVYKSVHDVGLVASSLQESATESLALHLNRYFVEYYGLDKKFFLEDATAVLFTCDDPQYYLILITALSFHHFDIEHTAWYFFQTPTEKILKDVSLHARNIAGKKRIEVASRRLERKIKAELGVEMNFGVEEETVTAAKAFPGALANFRQKRLQAAHFPKILRGEFLQSYLNGNAQTFLRESMRIFKKEIVVDFMVSRISSVYNRLLTTPRADLDLPGFRKDLVFALQLYEWLQKNSPREAFRIEHIVQLLRKL